LCCVGSLFSHKCTGVETQEDWYNLTLTDAREYGIYSIISRYYGTSVFHALQSIYPEYEWNPNRCLHQPKFLQNMVPINHWKDMKNQRERLDTVARQLGIQKQEDWYQITSERAIKFARSGLLLRHYKGSIISALKSVYPEFYWNPLLFVSCGNNTLASIDKSHITDFFERSLEGFHDYSNRRYYILCFLMSWCQF
jgi:hypothetical protein